MEVIKNIVDTYVSHKGTSNIQDSPFQFTYSMKLSKYILAIQKELDISRGNTIPERNIENIEDADVAELSLWLLLVQKDIWRKKSDLAGIKNLNKVIQIVYSSREEIDKLYERFKNMFEYKESI